MEKAKSFLLIVLFCLLGTVGVMAQSPGVDPPQITAQPSTSGQTQFLGGVFNFINVTATGNGTETLSYQWYSSTQQSSTSGTRTLITGATTNEYTPVATSKGSLYYYCIVIGEGGLIPSKVSGAFIVKSYAGDTNGNGVIDGTEIAGDQNNDGVITAPELAGDLNGNGIIDGTEIAGDKNGNGKITSPEIAGDTNGDGTIGAGEIAGDKNGDGIITAPEIAGDKNGNGVLDGDEIVGDKDGNGVINGTEITGDLNGNGVITAPEVKGDKNGDGIVDVTIIVGDKNGDGKITAPEISGDVNEDGKISSPEIAGDTNGDGTIGTGEIAGDKSGDGKITSPEISGDVNGNGVIDGTEVCGDASGNGAIDGTEVSCGETSKQLTVKVYLQGLWNGSGMNKCKKYDDSLGDVVDLFAGNVVDTISVELHNSTYSNIAYKLQGLELHQDGTVTTTGLSYISVPLTINGDYYVTVITRNHLETTTASLVSFSGTTVAYDFTDAVTKAFESDPSFTPMIQKDGKWMLYTGNPLPLTPPQVNTDAIETIDLYDVITKFSDATGIYGYLPEDLNGDGSVDTMDLYTFMIPNNTLAVYFYFPE